MTSLDSVQRVNGTEVVQCPCCGSANAAWFLSAPDRFHRRACVYDLFRCLSCSVVWLKNLPTPSEMGQHYTAEYDRAISLAGHGPEFWSDRRRTVLRYKSEGTLLDLGCSSGGFLSTMRNRSWKLHGVEMSEQMAEQARTRTGARVFVGDILDASFPSESFDVITCFHVFEHVYKPKEVLEKVYNWLKPGGIFYAEMPNIDSFDARICRSYGHLELPRHLYHFSPTSLRRLFAAAGFREMLLSTSRATYIEYTLGYILDDLCAFLGFPRSPASARGQAPFAWRAVRKVNRLTMLALFARLASAFGQGPDLRAVFQKA
jgi:SAM-dependent methyltransferase